VPKFFEELRKLIGTLPELANEYVPIDLKVESSLAKNEKSKSAL
jgi:hypothetical protein